MPANWPEISTAAAERFINGDEDAFKTVYNLFVQPLMAYATAICGSNEQAEDIVQDVFVICWEKKDQIQCNALGHWLVKVTRNRSVKAFRRNVLMAEYVADNHHQPAEETSLHDHSLESRALKIVNTLPPSRKKIFLLSRIDQKSYRQIAEELGISIRTVENQIAAALKQIRYQSGTPEIIFLIVIVLSC